MRNVFLSLPPIQAQVVNNKTVFIGRPLRRSRGRAYARGRERRQLVNDPCRIVKPMKRTGRGGEWQVLAGSRAQEMRRK
ncbi:hypothetical protein KCP76_25920 [Salmonella enterica subsp. enterica serovar Weltevreden]|nr:hypothetical protein KCP76_25920 [Salmonella enterica subsp. enterica serovar Weltevreden]